MRSATCLAFLLILSSVACAGELGVEDAYQAIPHRRTPFEVTTSTLSTSESEALKRLFELTDRGVVVRVQGLQAQHAADVVALERVSSGYSSLTYALATLAVPATIENAKAHILQSVQLHQHHFEVALNRQRSNAEASAKFQRSDEIVQASSHLHSAYGLLMKSFPDESSRNRQAFFDHLCALDFL